MARCASSSGNQQSDDFHTTCSPQRARSVEPDERRITMKKSKLWTLPAIAIAALLAAYLPARLRAQQAPEPAAPPEPPEVSVNVPPIPDMPDMIDLDAQLAPEIMSSGWLGLAIDE